MASNDSGVDTSNDSSDSIVISASVQPATAPPAPPPQPSMDLSKAFENQLIRYYKQSINTLSISSNNSNNSSSGQHDLVCAIRLRKDRSRQIKKKIVPIYLNELKERQLRFAASVCNTELLTTLLESGTNPNSSDEHKRSPLHIASCRGYADVVAKLLDYGANPNIIDSLGNTPLHLAVISASSNNLISVVRTLLQGGASVFILDRSGKNPLQLAQSKLNLIRTRYTNPRPEMRKIKLDMYTLILELYVHSLEEKNNQEVIGLAESLNSLNVNDADTPDVDNLLAKVEELSIAK